MPDPTFSQSEPRSAKPILLAAGALALLAAAVFYFNPHDTAALSLSETSAIPTRTNFKSDSIVVGENQAGQDDLYVLTTIHLADHLRLPITIDTILCTLITADGQQTTASAAARDELPAIFKAFPQLKPLASPALLRETVVNPGTAVDGQVVFHFPITKAVWDSRKSATLEVDLYHQTPQSILIP